MLAHGERLGQRGQFGRDRVGHRKQQQLLEHHVLGQRARDRRWSSRSAPRRRAHDDGDRAHPGPDGQGARRVGPVLDDLRAELVAEHAVGRGVERGTPTEPMSEVKCAKSPSAWRSEPQIPAASERATTWPEDGTGSAMSSTTSATPGHRGSHADITSSPPRYGCEVSLTHPPARRLFEGRVALVTGAARPRGIGRATALALAAGGADVACLDIARPYTDAPDHGTAGPDDLASLQAEIEALGARAVTLEADVSDEAAVERAVAQATEQLGPVTLVANVAGGSGPGFGFGPLLGVTAAEFRRVLDVNVVGTWMVSKACATRMVEAGLGRPDLQCVQPGRQARLPVPRRLLRRQGGRDPVDPDHGRRAGPLGHLGQRGVPGHGGHRPAQPRRHVRDAPGRPRALAQWIAREIPLGRLQEADEIAAAIAGSSPTRPAASPGRR